MLLYLIGCIGSLLVGIMIGARGYYLYANHIYMNRPELFLKVLEDKIQKKQEQE